MAKIRLGARPKNFKRIVKFPMLDGSEGAIECSFKYRTRTEYGSFVDSLTEAAKVTVTADDAPFSLARLMEKTAGSNATYILQVIDGWNLIDEDDKPVDLSRENVQQLADELPAAAIAIVETYRLACTEGRLGN